MASDTGETDLHIDQSVVIDVTAQDGGTKDFAVVLHDDIYLALGKLSAAWGTLDYCLRLALKRIQKKSMDEAHAIFRITGHSDLICKLRTAANKEKCEEVVKIVDSVGKSGEDGLYKRRNNYTHAVWTKTEDGSVIYHRVGGIEWKKPIDVDVKSIEQLIEDIRGAALDIETATRDQLG